MMKRNLAATISATILVAGLMFATRLPAQDQSATMGWKHHHRYKLIDLGTFGGPNSSTNGSSVVINEQGTVVGGAETDMACPYLPEFPIGPAFKWERGVMTELPRLPGGCFGFAIAINSEGTIVGSADNGVLDPLTGEPEIRAVVWKDSQIIDLGTFGGANSLATNINERGQVAGIAQNDIPDFFPFGDGVSSSPTQWHAFLWEKGAMHDLGTLGGPDSGTAGALALNERGQVTGVSYTNFDVNPTTGEPTLNVFLWNRNRMRGLGTLGGTFADARTINNRGQIVGFATLAGDLEAHPFLWDRGSMKDLGTLGGSFGVAGWINDAGQAVGASLTAGDEFLRGFIWSRGRMTSIEPLEGDTCSDAFLINGRGQVIGPSFDCNGEGTRGYLWDDGVIIDLNGFVPPGSDLHLADPLFINDRGEIAIAGFLPNGDEHAVVLLPCNEHEVDGCLEASQHTEAAPSGPVSSALATKTAARTRLTQRGMFANYRARLSRSPHVTGLGAPRQ